MPLAPEKLLIPKQSNPQKIEVIWVDACSNSGQWEDNQEWMAGMEMGIVGYLIKQTKNYITLAMEVPKWGSWRKIFSIPMCNVVKIKRLK